MIKKQKVIIFACKFGRLRDIPLLRKGAHAAGYAFVPLLVPFAYPVLLLAAVIRSFGLDISLIVSDRFVGDRWLAFLFRTSVVRMLWNYADEFPSCLQSAPSKRVCFFEDPQQSVEFFCFAPQPSNRMPVLGARREVVFVGDVSSDCPLPQGLDWWEGRLRELMQSEGYSFYLGADYGELLDANVTSFVERRAAKVLTKNLLRLWIVQAARREFGSRIVLVGSNWSKFSMQALPSAYSVSERLKLYTSAMVHLDCGSKSGDSALYPRSSELISYVGAPIQVQCSDSAAVFGARASEIVFRDEITLNTLIAQRLSEGKIENEARSDWLANHLARQRLTMADSLKRLFEV